MPQTYLEVIEEKIRGYINELYPKLEIKIEFTNNRKDIELFIKNDLNIDGSDSGIISHTISAMIKNKFPEFSPKFRFTV